VAWEGSGWSNLTREQYTSDRVKGSPEDEPVAEEEPEVELSLEELLKMLEDKGYGNLTETGFIVFNETASGKTTAV